MTSSAAMPPMRTAQALSAYQSIDGSSNASPVGGDFSSFLSKSLQGAVQSGQQADTQAMQAISGKGDLTEVVAALSRAQLALQSTVAIRDRVIQAYQDVIKMPI